MDPRKPLDGLNRLGKKRVQVELKNNTILKGILDDFDYNMHLVLREGEEIDLETQKRTKYGTLLVRGNNIISIRPA